jgi:hypothetical protein
LETRDGLEEILEQDNIAPEIEGNRDKVPSQWKKFKEFVKLIHVSQRE